MMILATLALPTRYSDILDFVRNADSVVTYVTNDQVQWQKANFDRHADIVTFNRKHHGQFVQQIAKGKRDSLIGFLKGVAGAPTNVFPSCFTPHHFVFAAKGKRHVELEICFTCAMLVSYGSFPYSAKVNREVLGKTEKVFGMKFDPHDPLPSISIKDRNAERPFYDISISKGKARRL